MDATLDTSSTRGAMCKPSSSPTKRRLPTKNSLGSGREDTPGASREENLPLGGGARTPHRGSRLGRYGLRRRVGWGRSASLGYSGTSPPGLFTQLPRRGIFSETHVSFRFAASICSVVEAVFG